MAKFTELAEQDRIQYIKDGFILILEQIAKDPSKLSNYIKLEKPTPHVAYIEPIPAHLSAADRSRLQEQNTIIQAKVDAENAKLDTEFKTKTETFKKIEAIIAKLEKKQGCMCGSCMNISITNNVIAPELDILIDVARKEAEEKAY
jgi:hypothetical protein